MTTLQGREDALKLNRSYSQHNKSCVIVRNDSNIENKISELKLKSMYKSNHPEYGKGFRIMDSELERYGWSKLLKKLESY